MVTVGDIYDALDGFCPFERCEPWDNAGLLVGSRGTQVTKAAVVLDITADAVEQAQRLGAQLMISHHPVIFHPLKSLASNDPAYLLAHYGIAAICAHTCLDCADGGVNDVLASILELKNVEKIECEEAKTPTLRVGIMPKPFAPDELARYVSDRLNARVRAAYAEGTVEKAAVCGGAGADFLQAAKEHGCQALVTGDAGHHDFLDAAALGITLIAAGHFETENPVVDILLEFVSGRFDIDVIKLTQPNPIRFI